MLGSVLYHALVSNTMYWCRKCFLKEGGLGNKPRFIIPGFSFIDICMPTFIANIINVYSNSLNKAAWDSVAKL